MLTIESNNKLCENTNPFELVQQQIDRVCTSLKISDGLHQRLRQCARELSVHFPVKMDNGDVQVFTGYRVQHNLARGPAKGGIRFHPDVTLDETRALATWMSMKTAVVNIPYGGAKGSVVCNPKLLSQSELERLTRRYTSEISAIIGPEQDIPAPDVGTNPQVMAWIMDTYSMNKGYSVLGVVTGKPIEIGGSKGRTEATGRGCMFTARLAAKHLGISLDGAKVAVQGFGNVGSISAKLLAKEGSKVIGVTNSQGGIYNAKGLNIDSVYAHLKKTGSLKGYRGSDAITNEELLALKCDVLVPAALEGAICAANADEVQARIIIEGANGPTTPEADAILNEKGIFVIPDILANAGGVVVSYFEWVQGLQSFFWSEQEINRQLQNVMEDAFKAVHDISLSKKVDMRFAAYILAINRIVNAMELRGIFP